MMCAFRDSNCHGFGDMWWTDKCTYFSSIDKLFFFVCFIFLCYSFFKSDFFLTLAFLLITLISEHNY